MFVVLVRCYDSLRVLCVRVRCSGSLVLICVRVRCSCSLFLLFVIAVLLVLFVPVLCYC